MKTRFSLLIIIGLVLGCKKIFYYPDKNIDLNPTKLIAHRGGRTDKLRENSMQGIRAALKQRDGVEVDVQISKSESIWLSHSEIVKGCGFDMNCFPETKDDDIRTVTTCNGADINYTQLDSVFSLMADSFPDKPICIDMKGWVPCSGNSLDIEGMMRREGEIIIHLAQKYGLLKNTLIEVEPSTVLDYLKAKNSGAPLYLVSYGNFERDMLMALKQGYTGISYKNNIGETLTKEMIDLMHKKGLKIIVWNLGSNNEINGLVNIGVDYIQIDL